MKSLSRQAAPRVVAFTCQPVLAEGFQRVFESADALDLAGVVTGSAALLKLIRRKHPDVALLDCSSIHEEAFLREARSAWAR